MVKISPSSSLHPDRSSRRYLHLLVFVVAGLIATGCNRKVSFNFKSSSPTSSSDWIVNNQRTSTRTLNGVTRKLETTADVQIQNGRVTKFPPGALLKLEETGGAAPRKAEMRDNAGTLELWMKDNVEVRRGSPEDDEWAARFLGDFSK